MSDNFKFFNENLDSSINANYTGRAERNVFLADYLSGVDQTTKIVNIGGGGERHLQKALDNQQLDCSVIELDIVGDCDYIVDLDQIDKLDFASNSFDVACATDVLEHLENFHLINSELLRISAGHIIISLPVSSSEVVNIVRDKYASKDRNENGIYSKFYGIPLSKPSDRHRWWMTFEDIVSFYREFASDHECDLTFGLRKMNAKHTLLRYLLGQRLYYNFFCPYVWIFLRKRA